MKFDYFKLRKYWIVLKLVYFYFAPLLCSSPTAICVLWSVAGEEHPATALLIVFLGNTRKGKNIKKKFSSSSFVTHPTKAKKVLPNKGKKVAGHNTFATACDATPVQSENDGQGYCSHGVFLQFTPRKQGKTTL